MLPVHINISLSFCVNQDSVVAALTCFQKVRVMVWQWGFGDGMSRKCSFFPLFCTRFNVERAIKCIKEESHTVHSLFEYFSIAGYTYTTISFSFILLHFGQFQTVSS